MYYKKGTVSNDAHGIDCVKSIILASDVGGAASSAQFKNAAGTEILFISTVAGATRQIIYPGDAGATLHLDRNGTVTIVGDANTRLRID